jgi:hypothetical protein
MLMAGPVMGATVELANGYRISDPDGDNRVATGSPWAIGNYGSWGDTSSSFTFLLPDVGPAVTAADVRLVLEEARDMETAIRQADLFVRNELRDSDSVTTADWIGPVDTAGNDNEVLNPSGWTLIQRAFVTGDLANNLPVTLNATGQQNLKDFINGQASYAGKYIVLGLGFDGNSEGLAGGVRFEFPGSASDGDGAEITNQLTLVPEPATMSLLGLGGLVALRRRRRA